MCAIESRVIIQLCNKIVEISNVLNDAQHGAGVMDATLPRTEAPPGMRPTRLKGYSPGGGGTRPHYAPASPGGRGAVHAGAGGRPGVADDRTAGTGNGGHPKADGGAEFSAGRRRPPTGAGGR